MDQVSYFRDRLHTDTIEYFVYLYHVIIKKNGKYWICDQFRETDNKGVGYPLYIEGEFKSLHTTLNTFAYICTDQNTYLYNNNVLTPCNCICSDVMVSRHCLILTTSHGILIYNSNNGDSSNTSKFHINPKLVDNLMICNNGLHGYDISLSYSFSTYPDEVYTVPSSMGQVWIVGFNKKYSVIHREVLRDINYSQVNIARLIVDYSPNTLFSSQNAYFISTTADVYRIFMGSEPSLTVLCTTNITDPWSIKEIVSFRDYCVIVGKDYLHMYSKIKNNVTNNVTNNLPSVCMTVEPDSLKVCSSIWSNMVLNYKSGFIVIGTQIMVNNPAIQITLMNEFKLPTTPVYEIMPAPNTKLYYSNGSYVSVDCHGVATDISGNIIWSDVKLFSNITRKLNIMDVQIELNANAFDQLLCTLITTNFNVGLRVSMGHKSIVQSAGPGLRRVIHNAVVEYMRSNLFILDSLNTLTPTYKINISHPYWLQNNGYYMGKLIAYLFNSNFTLPFHMSLNRLYAIYEQIQSRTKSDKINVDSLAPFHKNFYPLDFVCMANLDDAYKLDDEKFKELALGYDSFLECIKNRLHMSPIPADEVPILSNIAAGLYDFNPKIATLSLWQLARFISGDFIYNRVAVINNINFSINDNKFEPYRIMMKAFVDGLTDDELIQFMITVTGYHVRNSPVTVNIINSPSGNQDILITTCYDKLSVACHVFERGYTDILKGYLCTRDNYIYG
jgi:hypothetical protein